MSRYFNSGTTTSNHFKGMMSVLIALYFAVVVGTDGMPTNILLSPPVDHPTPHPPPFNWTLVGGAPDGDMILPPAPDPTTRGVARYGDIKWLNKIVPYDISAISNAADRKKITDAMSRLMFDVGSPIAGSEQRSACVFFRPREAADRGYFKIQYGNGCSTNVGYVASIQSTMTLQQNGCFSSGTIQHELMHVLGFFHEQSRPDRDTYLQINLQNVEPAMQHQFNKYAWGSTAYQQDTPYDYASIMQYESDAFSMNGKPTMVPRQAGVIIGRAEKLSPTDIFEVRHLYGCKA